MIADDDDDDDDAGAHQSKGPVIPESMPAAASVRPCYRLITVAEIIVLIFVLKKDELKARKEELNR